MVNLRNDRYTRVLPRPQPSREGFVNDIRIAVVRVARRLNFLRFVDLASSAAYWLFALVIVAIAADKVVHTGVDARVYLLALPAALALALVLTLRARATTLEAAVELDRRLDV
jgi:hypothetical protein